MPVISTNHATATAVDAFRKAVILERKLHAANEELINLLTHKNVNMNDYQILTDEIEQAASEGRSVHNVGLVNRVHPDDPQYPVVNERPQSEYPGPDATP